MARAGDISLNVFSDEVFSSTELARRTSDVLNTAKDRPVTISRNRDQFAILRRETVSELLSKLSIMQDFVDVLAEVQRVQDGKSPSETFAWLTAFESDDLQKLASEVVECARQASIGRAEWGHVTATIHEWKESAEVALSGVLDQAIRSRQELITLPDPETLILDSEADGQ